MDLSSLMSALQSEQKKQSSVRLSDRNVVELVMKLKQLGLFGDELLHTINGKEYITTDRLKADIQTALRQAGGRLELTELPALVGVDLVHCEKQVCVAVLRWCAAPSWLYTRILQCSSDARATLELQNRCCVPPHGRAPHIRLCACVHACPPSRPSTPAIPSTGCADC